MADGLKDRNLQDYYESLGAMHTTPGWKFFAEDLDRLLKAADTLQGITLMEELFFRRGQIDILQKMLAQPDVIAAAYAHLLSEENDE